MIKFQFIRRHSDALFSALLVAIVLSLYLPSIHLGMFWDDPNWYKQGAGQSVWQLLTSVSSYQFYRPLAIFLNRQLVSAGGIVNVPLDHVLQVAAHVIASVLSVFVLRVFNIEKWPARLAAVVFAIYPLAYQAVAWAAPEQPSTMMWLFASLILADHFQTFHGQKRFIKIGLLMLSAAAYAAALLFQESAVPFVIFFFGLAYLRRQESTPKLKLAWPLLHLALALGYFLIWLNVPRLSGVTGRGLQPIVLAYALQGVVFPVAGLFSALNNNWPVPLLVVLFLLCTAALILGVWKWQSKTNALFISLWILAGILPIWVGLSWKYVQIGSRLLYPAALGVAALWGSWMAWLITQLGWRRIAGGIIALSVIVTSIYQWSLFQRLYTVGAQQLDRAIAVLAARPDSHFLFINFPDRLELQPPLYPLGYWGLILAPVIQNLSDFARATTGVSGSDQSLAAFSSGDRSGWPYAVNLRGSNAAPPALYDAATRADSVYLTGYESDGTLSLREVGHILSNAPDTPPLAIWDQRVKLVQADLVKTDSVTIHLAWQTAAALTEADAIFVHLFKDNVFYRAYDADSLGGLIPLSAWQPHAEIYDIRHIPLADLPGGQYEIRVGIYDRAGNTRYAATGSAQNNLPDNAYPVGSFAVP